MAAGPKEITELLNSKGTKVSYGLVANVLGRMSKGKRGKKRGRKPGARKVGRPAGRNGAHGLNGLSGQLGPAIEFATSVGGLGNAMKLLEALNTIKTQL